MSEFRNEPLIELRRSSERDRLTAALRAVDDALPLRVPVLVDGDRRDSPELQSIDPGTPDRIVATAAAAGPDEVKAAVDASSEASRSWGARSAADRAETLTRGADELRRRRHELAALAVRECAKPWADADADVCEAIDYLEYYARQAELLAVAPELVEPPGERNSLAYRPRGVVAVIAPWNFPFAIATGMTAAGLATGNAVCLKPAEQSPGCALALVEALHRGGVPAGALALLPGEGDVGAALVANPCVHTIAFTGSGAVGLEILERAAVPAAGQRHLKRVVAEMGGKNCILVDADADLEDVVPALLASAFGFAGQKCSAASRVLAHQRIAEPLLERLRASLDTILVGQAETFGVDVPPVIERESLERIERVVEEAVAEGATAHRVREIPRDGFFASPTVMTGASPEAAVTRDEIFGPVLTIDSMPSMEAACEVVESLPYALTGGLFSRNPRVVAEVARRTPVGNLYVNRHITGAMVGRQPFGGNRLSGTGTKAGGPDYLLHFVEPVVVTENTVRHGLAL